MNFDDILSKCSKIIATASIHWIKRIFPSNRVEKKASEWMEILRPICEINVNDLDFNINIVNGIQTACQYAVDNGYESVIDVQVIKALESLQTQIKLHSASFNFDNFNRILVRIKAKISLSTKIQPRIQWDKNAYKQEYNKFVIQLVNMVEKDQILAREEFPLVYSKLFDLITAYPAQESRAIEYCTNFTKKQGGGQLYQVQGATRAISRAIPGLGPINSQLAIVYETASQFHRNRILFIDRLMHMPTEAKAAKEAAKLKGKTSKMTQN